MIERTPLLLPCFVKSPDSQPDPDQDLHPIGILLRRKRFAQAALGMSIGLAISTACFRFDSQILFSPSILTAIVAAVLTSAAVVVWNVNLLAILFPAASVAVEKAALAALLFPFFAVVNALLNQTQGVGWIPWMCLVASVMVIASVRVSPPPVVTFKALDWVR